jgi:hypothetical protein
MKKKGRKMKCLGLFIIAVGVIVLCGCKPQRKTAIGALAAQLEPSMTETNVSALFSGYRTSASEFEGAIERITTIDPMVVFQTNTSRGKKVTYWPENTGWFSYSEYCEVYFDTNGTIVGYFHSRD